MDSSKTWWAFNLVCCCHFPICSAAAACRQRHSSEPSGRVLACQIQPIAGSKAVIVGSISTSRFWSLCIRAEALQSTASSVLLAECRADGWTCAPRWGDQTINKSQLLSAPVAALWCSPCHRLYIERPSLLWDGQLAERLEVWRRAACFPEWDEDV